MKVVILAGGLGTRIRGASDRIPKPMTEIGGRPILWHIMKFYTHYGFSDFVICLGYRGYVIKEYFNNYALHMSDITLDIRNETKTVHENVAEPWRVTLVDTGHATQTGGRLKRVRNWIGNETFCFTYGDGLSNVNMEDLIAFHRQHGKLCTVTAIRPPGRFGVLDIEDGRVARFSEKTDTTNDAINGGFFVVEPGALDYIDGDESIWERGPMERLAADRQMMAYRHEGFWQPMDTLRDKRLLDGLWAEGNAPWKLWP